MSYPGARLPARIQRTTSVTVNEREGLRAQIEGRDELDTCHSYYYESVLASALPGRTHGRILRRVGLIELDWSTLYIRLCDCPSFEYEFYVVEDIYRTSSFINERFFGHESR